MEVSGTVDMALLPLYMLTDLIEEAASAESKQFVVAVFE